MLALKLLLTDTIVGLHARGSFSVNFGLAYMKMPGKQPGNYVGLRSSCETARNKTLAWKMLSIDGHLVLELVLLQETAMTGKYVLASPAGHAYPVSAVILNNNIIR